MITVVPKESDHGKELLDLPSGEHCHPHASTPTLHKAGYVVDEIPNRYFPDLHQLVSNALWLGVPLYDDDGGGVIPSICQAGCVPRATAQDVMSSMHSSAELRELVETFSGCQLVPTEWYGPRVYMRGSSLLRHVDRKHTHTVGVTLYIDSSDHKPWPIVFEQDDCFVVVSLKPGQLAIYEGERIKHFRPYALEAEYYATAFFHFALADRKS